MPQRRSDGLAPYAKFGHQRGWRFSTWRLIPKLRPRLREQRARSCFIPTTPFTSDPADVIPAYVHDDTRFCYTGQHGHIYRLSAFATAAFGRTAFVRLRGRSVSISKPIPRSTWKTHGIVSPNTRSFHWNFGTHQGIVLNFTADADGVRRASVGWNCVIPAAGARPVTRALDANERWPAVSVMMPWAISPWCIMFRHHGQPSIRIARNVCDPRTMTTETSIVAGTASNGSNRYGDCNALNNDPATDRISGYYGTA